MPKMTMADLAEREFAADAAREGEPSRGKSSVGSHSGTNLATSTGAPLSGSARRVGPGTEAPRSNFTPFLAAVALAGLLAAIVSGELRKAEAATVFVRVDVDGSGMLSSSEIAGIGTQLGLGWGEAESAVVVTEVYGSLSPAAAAQRAAQRQVQEALVDTRTIRALLWRATRLYADTAPIITEKLAELTEKRALFSSSSLSTLTDYQNGESRAEWSTPVSPLSPPSLIPSLQAIGAEQGAAN